MSMADDAYGVIGNAIEKTEAARALLQGALYQETAAIAANLASVKDTIEKAGRNQVAVTQHVQEAISIAREQIAGSAGDSGEALDLLAKVAQENEDQIAKLRYLHDEVDKLAREILPVYSEENERNVGRLGSATDYLVGYQSYL